MSDCLTCCVVVTGFDHEAPSNPFVLKVRGFRISVMLYSRFWGKRDLGF